MILKKNLFSDDFGEHYLQVGRYNVYVTGGLHTASQADFQVTLMNSKTMEKVRLERLQGVRLSNGRMAGILTFLIENSGDYQIDVINPNSIEVKRTMNFAMNWILKRPEKKKINLIIERS